MTIDFIRGDSLAWIADHDPRLWAVLVTDPPFGINYQLHGHGAGCKFTNTSIMGDADASARDAVLKWWGDGAAAVFGSSKVPHYGSPRGVLTWDKMGTGMGDIAFPWTPDNAEEIAIYGLGWHGSRGTSILRYPVVRGDKHHPHEKPLSLLEHILAKSPPGPVLDLFGGSGSTAEAAHRLGRDCTVIELDPRWWPAIQARVERLHAQLDMFAVG
jgi:hypothetical protein